MFVTKDFSGKCENCGREMRDIGGDEFYGAQLFWCKNCGTLLEYFGHSKISVDKWYIPAMTNRPGGEK